MQGLCRAVGGNQGSAPGAGWALSRRSVPGPSCHLQDTGGTAGHATSPQRHGSALLKHSPHLPHVGLHSGTRSPESRQAVDEAASRGRGGKERGRQGAETGRTGVG